MASLMTRTIQNRKTSTILQRIADKDKTAVKDCIDAYGNFIWTLARKFTKSHEEAEAATEKIFIDIWQYCESARCAQSIEEKLIAMIALRRLIKPFSVSQTHVYGDTIDKSNEQGAGMDRISESF